MHEIIDINLKSCIKKKKKNSKPPPLKKKNPQQPQNTILTPQWNHNHGLLLGQYWSTFKDYTLQMIRER